MADWVIAELRYKAELFKKTGAVHVYDGDVVKSDTAIPSDLKVALQEAVKVLEDVPEHKKDYHPNSDGKVIDLVHPSLFPLIYGRSRVLTDSLVGLDDCIKRCGEGKIVPVPPEAQQFARTQFLGSPPKPIIDHDISEGYSKDYQVNNYPSVHFT